jgi:hypothetical protein
MINLETMLSTAPREAGVVYTKPWVVELVLDLAGYVPDRRLPAIQQDRLFNKKVLTSQIRQKADASGLKL